jgi:hypothetical protein
MLVRRLAVSAAFLLAVLVSAAPQDFDRDAYARDYVQFQVLQLDQWSKEFPQQFYANLMRPPVDASKLSEAAKASAGELGETIKRLAALSTSKDVMTNAEFRTQLDKALTTLRELNQAMSTQRFPAPLQSSWDQVRSVLNNLARIYKLDALAVFDPPGGGGGGRGGRSGRGPATAAATGPVPGGLAGYIVDLSCSKRGKGMWANPDCVARCVRDGDKLVLVTEEGKIYQIANQDKIAPESYGLVVTLTGKTEGDTITVESLKL